MKMRQKPLYITIALCSIVLVSTVGFALSGSGSGSAGFFTERNCNSFVMHVSSLMYDGGSSRLISRSGNKKELLRRCQDNAFSYMMIDCSLNSSTIEGVHACLYTDFSKISTGGNH